MNQNNEELLRLSYLIGLIYEGATDPSRWTRDILPAVAEYIQAPECILFTNLHTPQNGGYFFIHGMTQDHVDLYMNKYHSHDVWTKAAIEQNTMFEGNVFTGDEIVPRQQLLESKIYKECLSRDINMAQLLAGSVFGMDSARSMPTAFSFFRGLHHDDFNEDDRARLRLILPHLSRSLGVLQRLQTAELAVATSMAALDRLPSGVLLLDSFGLVAFANIAAKNMLNNNDGLRLSKLTNTTGLGKLVADNIATSKAIDHAISATLNRVAYDIPHFSRCIKVPRTSGTASYNLQFSSLGDHIEFGESTGAYSTIIFMIDSTHELSVDPSALQSAYGLTPAEAKVAVLLLESSSAQEVAEKLGTSLNTVRSQIKQIYTKLGVDSRARFVKLLLGMSKQQL
jgi:DNA-binding CsgD family transcriptional regulator